MELRKSKKGHKRDIIPFKFENGETVLIKHLFGGSFDCTAR